MKYISFVVVLVVSGLSSEAQTDSFDKDSLVVSGAAPRLIASQFSFTEGASVDRKGNVFFTDQPNNKIWEYDIDGRLTLWMDSAGRSNGTYFDREGNLVTCADDKGELWSISPDKKVTILMKDLGGHQLNGPNDCWIDRKGGIYFTDPYYQRPYWTRTKPDIDGMKVYYLPKGKDQAILVADSLVRPNGIVGTPDGKWLYVADIQDRKTYKYRINKDATLTDRQLFAEMGSDGITLDEKGNLYLTGKGVTVFNPSGEKIAYIPVGTKSTSNLCFGGKGKKELFITAVESVYVLPMRVKGVE